MDKKIKILVKPSDVYGCYLHRFLVPYTYIKNNYGDLFEIDIKHEFPRDIPLDQFLSQYDILHFHKQMDNNCEIINMAKFLGLTVIMDIDDMWDLGNDHPMSITARQQKWHEPVINHIKLADYVTTTTEIFKKEISKFNKNVFVHPNAIDPNYPAFQLKGTTSDKLRFGIICGSSHLKDIELMDGMTKQLSKETLDKMQFVLCGFDTNGTRTIMHQDTGKIERRPILPQESVWYDYEKIITDNYKIVSSQHKDFLEKFIKNTEYPDISESYRRCWTKDINSYYTHYDNIDVLLVPLKENRFNSCKSDLKVAEAGFAHKAIIASNVPPYTIALNSMIEKGGKINENGNALLIDSSKNHKLWAKYITKLVEDREMVKKLQDNLYKTANELYHIDVVCKHRVNCLLEAMKIDKTV